MKTKKQLLLENKRLKKKLKELKNVIFYAKMLLNK
jgi:hypothetical protein